MQESFSRRSFLSGSAVAAGVALASNAGARATGFARAAESQEQVGTYASTQPSMKGDITVFIGYDGQDIVSVDVLDDVDTKAIRAAAIDSVPRRVVEQQNVEVDVACGATVTSNAILAGVVDCLEQAGADVDAFRKGSDAVERTAGETQTADVVIVGSGMSGLSAAVAALDANPEAKVVVLEKQAYTGGSALVCGGGIWSFGSQANERVGADCSFEDYVSFMQMRSEPSELNTDLMRSIYDVSGSMFDLIFDWGMPVNTATWGLGHPDSQIPIFWSNIHLEGDYETGDSGFIDFMTIIARRFGADIRLNSRVTELLADGGSVSGVRVEDAATTYDIEAGKVILATGGFTRNADYVEAYAPDYVDAFAFTGGGSTGDGIAMTEALGAHVVGNGMMGLVGLNPNLGYYGPYGNLALSAQLSVGADGQDTGIVDAFYADTLDIVLAQPGSCAYGVFDDTCSEALHKRLEDGVALGYVRRYDSLDELASGEGIDADGLAGAAEARGIGEAPFWCVTQRGLFIGSIPGLAVDACCRVLGEDDAPVGNLYAVGELTFGNVFCGQYASSGTGIATSCYTGAIAARDAVAAQ